MGDRVRRVRKRRSRGPNEPARSRERGAVLPEMKQCRVPTKRLLPKRRSVPPEKKRRRVPVRAQVRTEAIPGGNPNVSMGQRNDGRNSGRRAAAAPPEEEENGKNKGEQEEKPASGEEEKKGPGLRTKLLMGVSNALSPISLDYSTSDNLSYSGIADRPDFVTRFGRGDHRRTGFDNGYFQSEFNSRGGNLFGRERNSACRSISACPCRVNTRRMTPIRHRHPHRRKAQHRSMYLSAGQISKRKFQRSRNTLPTFRSIPPIR